VLTSATWNRRGWNDSRLLAALGLAGSSVAITFDAWKDIYRIASRDEESSHVFLVPIVVAWLFWVRRRRLRHVCPTQSFSGPLVVACGWIVHSVGDTYLLQSCFHAGAIMMAVGCLLTMFGAALLREFLPVFLTLVFLIPVPGRVRQQIAVPLQTVTAQVTGELFNLMGAPVMRTGNTLSINGADIQIVEACNGLRMMFALSLATFAFAFGSPLRGYARVVVLIATPVSAIACNVVRLIPTVWLYGNYPSDVATLVHDIGGWVMLVMSFLILLGIVRLIRWAKLPVTTYTLAYD
jgi:exosortase